jgi:hypothetical protein
LVGGGWWFLVSAPFNRTRALRAAALTRRSPHGSRRRPELHQGELLDQPPASARRAVVAPPDQLPEHGAHEWRDQPVAALVVGEDGGASSASRTRWHGTNVDRPMVTDRAGACSRFRNQSDVGPKPAMTVAAPVAAS